MSLGIGVGVGARKRSAPFGGYNPLAALGAALLAWYDAADASTLFTDVARTTPANVGDGVGGWADKSGSGNHAQQASGAQRPSRAAGGVLTFAGSQRIACADFAQPTQAQPFTAVVVGTNTLNLSTEFDIASPRCLMQRGSAATTLQIHSGATYAPAGAPDLAERRIKTGIYNGAASVIEVNGTTVGTVGNAGANGLIGVSIGGNSTNFLVTGTGTTPLGKAEGLCEVLFIAGALTAPQEAALYAYLTAKWL